MKKFSSVSQDAFASRRAVVEAFALQHFPEAGTVVSRRRRSGAVSVKVFLDDRAVKFVVRKNGETFAKAV